MRCFSSPGSPRCPMDSDSDDPKGPGCPIRKSADQSLLTAPRSLSQRATSFIASQCQGIHQMPLRRLIQLPPRTGPKTREPKTPRVQTRYKTITRYQMSVRPKLPRSRPKALGPETPFYNPIHNVKYQKSEDRSQKSVKQPTRLVGVSQPKPKGRRLVEVIGFEPTTPCLQSRCSPS